MIRVLGTFSMAVSHGDRPLVSVSLEVIVTVFDVVTAFSKNLVVLIHMIRFYRVEV